MFKYIYFVLIFLCFQHQKEVYELVDERITQIIDMEKIEDSIVFTTYYTEPLPDNYPDNYEGPDIHSLYQLDLQSRRITSIISEKFDGYYGYITKFQDNTFTTDLFYDMETELNDVFYNISGVKKKLTERKKEVFASVYEKQELLKTKYQKILDCNVWKVVPINDSYIIAISTYGDKVIHKIIMFDPKSGESNMLFSSNSRLAFCLDKTNLYVIKDNKLIIENLIASN